MMSTTARETVRVLLIEDNPADADLIREVLDDIADTAPAAPHFELVHAERLSSGVEQLGGGELQVVLLDLSLPDSQGLESFRRLDASFPSVPVVVLSGLDDQVLAAQAVREGAQDYLVKGQVDAEVLGRSLRYAIERQRAERERAQRIHEQVARAEAEAALREHSAFLATICHDLRTPLTTIRARSQLLSRRLASGRASEPARLQEALVLIDEAAARLAGMLDEMVDVARLKAGGLLELERAPTDLVELAARLVDDFRGHHENRQVRLETAERTLIGQWDRGRLARVLDNLLANAVKYSAPGTEVVLTIEREHGTGESEWAVVRVRDAGFGIPSDDLPHIFDRFYRGRNVTGRIQGSGIGLAGVRQLVEQHGGTVTVESREGRGSTFTVRLPLD